MKKRLPPATLEAVFPPNKEFKYFQDCGNHPFRHRENGFELVNAWWLAEASLLAYADAKFAKERFAEAGLEVEDVRPFTGSTHYYVAKNEKFAIVTFRGTQVLKPGSPLVETFHDVVSDIQADAKVELIACEEGGKVHKGFQDALDEVWEARLKPQLDRLKASGLTLWFTGHSLGGALATLAANRYGEAQGLYTFGSPKVGDEEFVRKFRVRSSFRFVNNNDRIARAPKVGSYEHIGQLRYIDSSGEKILDHLSKGDRLVDRLQGDVRRLAGQLKT